MRRPECRIKQIVFPHLLFINLSRGDREELICFCMKTFYFLLVFLICCFASLSAQEEVFRYPLPNGGQPFNYNFTKANKVHCKKYDRFVILDEWDKYYDYSKDSLSLTVKAPWGKQYIKYNVDGTMASFSSPVNNWNDTYTYTDDGRIAKIEGKTNENKNSFRCIYSYDNSTITKMFYHYSEVYDKFFLTHKEVFEYDSDYIKHTDYSYNDETDKWEHPNISISKVDHQGRVIEYGYDNNGEYSWQFRYTYTNNGYKETLKYLGDSYVRREYTFNEQGDLIKVLWYEGSDVNDLRLSTTTEYTYTYSNPTSNENIKQQGYKVYSTENGLVIENNMGNSNIKASVYAITGQLLRTISISNNRTEIPLSSGIYIVVIYNQSHKVMVK